MASLTMKVTMPRFPGKWRCLSCLLRALDRVLIGSGGSLSKYSPDCNKMQKRNGLLTLIAMPQALDVVDNV